MELPRIAGTRPAKMDLEPGTYWWCSCGLSASQPFCDGSHEGTGFEPVRLEISEPTFVALCTCKRSARGPHCDGAHRGLEG